MTLSPELVASLFTGLTALIAGFSTFIATRSKKVSDEQKELRKRVRELERITLIQTTHMFTLELAIARAGGTVPNRPEGLEPDES